MKNSKSVNNGDYIAVYDSGIGGLNVLKLLKKYLPYENYLYFSDSANAPYGNKKSELLNKLAIKNVKSFEPYGIKAVVLACNTLSAVCYEKLVKRTKIKFIKTLPPIKNGYYGEKTYLICTFNTANSTFVKKNKGSVKVLPALNLASKIERDIFSLNSIEDEIFTTLKSKKPSTLILGCTHYAFLLKKFKKLLPNTQIIQPEFCTMLSLNDFLNENGLKNNSTSDGKILFIGESANFNRYVYQTFCLKN